MYYKICYLHGKHDRSCKICRPEQALSASVRRCVRGALQRKGIPKIKKTLLILGVRSWRVVFDIICKKIASYNNLFPNNPIQGDFVLDHIKPVCKFKENDMHLCNHVTNLQPLPSSLNMRKGSQWSSVDERVWQKKIIKNTRFLDIYLPVAMMKSLDSWPSKRRKMK